ncbi:MAG: hypothetical protein CYPHOPRED_000199 [Cyphobasidiales sp. Tagirdzhanova-0007]|nr:MAG: hypothetical protein CYPHOPRED_000199 [Cyphobasidiales sp. Tagirdzhanova-0007]
MGSYIASATTNIELICEEIVKSEKLPSAESLRLAVVAYRDHPPQDVSYVTKTLNFTSAVPEVKEFLKNLYASGGGDGPEAVTAAMKECMFLEWREMATKMVVLVADAPPHGIGEYGDGFSNGSPEGSDPLQLARDMAKLGIALFVVACEPALSQYTHATDFFRALSQLSSGVMLPLTNAALLARVIVGSALEHLDMERLIQEVGAAVAMKIHGNQESVDDVAKELHERLMLRNESTKQLVIEDIYRQSSEADHNVSIWMNASDLASAKPHLKKVSGSRFTDKYLEARYGTRTEYRAAPTVPPRSTSSERRSSPVASPGGPSSSPGSPSRKVAANFASFSATPMSFETTPVAPAPVQPSRSIFGAIPAPPAPTSTGTGSGLGSAFGGIRDSSALSNEMSMDDEDEEEGEGVSMKRGAISLEQAKRITMQSAWRGLRA